MCIRDRLYRASNSDTPLYALVERFNGAIGRKLLPLFETEKPDVVISCLLYTSRCV